MENTGRIIRDSFIAIGGAVLSISYPFLLVSSHQPDQEYPSAYHATFEALGEFRERPLEVSEPYSGRLVINLPENDRGLVINLQEDRGLTGIDVPIDPI